jgi:hypothetical protein
MLGALDAQEHVQVQKAIDSDPNLEEQLLAIKGTLAPLEVIDRPVGPPAGLARRTCQVISMAARVMERDALFNQSVSEFKTVETGSGATHSQANPGVAPASANVRKSTANANGRTSTVKISADSSIHSWMQPALSLSDFVVGVLAVGVIGALLFPAILTTRFNHRVTLCQNNLGGIYQALATYADNHDGIYPQIPTQGPMRSAGAFALTLKDNGLIDHDGIFFCPGLAHNSDSSLPTVEKICCTTCPIEQQKLRDKASGDFGYSMGYLDGRIYYPARESDRSNRALVADAPRVTPAGWKSPNHSGRGSNSLMEDGTIKFISNGMIGSDSIYQNEIGIVAPGCHANDSVIASSGVPITMTLSVE